MKRARICILLALTLVFVLGFGSTALAMGDCPYSVSINMDSSYTATTSYEWTDLEKTANPDSMTLGIGDSQTVNYTITPIKTPADTAITGSMSAKFTISPAGNANDGNTCSKIVINIWIEKEGSSDKLYLEEDKEVRNFSGHGPTSYSYEPAFTPEIGASYKVKYEGKIYWVYNYGYVHNKLISGSKDIEINQTDSVEPVTITDSGISGLPSGISASPDGDYNAGTWTTTGPVTYTVEYTNNSYKREGTFNAQNTASIAQTEISDSATVVVNTSEQPTTPKPTKKPDPPEPREERKVRWPDRTPPPEELESAAVVELPKTGGLIEWEWIALASGMLASGGGALYLVRRRKNKR